MQNNTNKTKQNKTKQNITKLNKTNLFNSNLTLICGIFVNKKYNVIVTIKTF